MQKVTREKPLHMLRQTWSKFENSHVSRLKTKYKWVHPKDRIPEWKIRVDDIVKIISGKEKGKVGKVIKVDKWANRVFVDNVNFSKKTPGIEFEKEDFDLSSINRSGSWWMRRTLRAIHVSNVSLIDPKFIKSFEEGAIQEKEVEAVRVELIKKKQKNKTVSFRYIPKLKQYYDPIKKEKKEIEKKETSARWDTRIEEVEKRTIKVNLLPPFPPSIVNELRNPKKPWRYVRILSNVVQLFDLFNSNYILRNLLFTSGYVSIQVATIGYIGGIFKTLPKMQLYLPNRPETLKILNPNQIRCYYWVIIIFQFFSIEIAAVYEGLSRIRNDEVGITVGYGLHWSFYGILHALITVALFYYGSALIKMTQQSFMLSGVIPGEEQEKNVELRFPGTSDGSLVPNEITIKRLKLIKNLRKMRIVSYTLMACFFMCTISLFAMAIMGYKLFKIVPLSQLYYALCNIGVPLACIAINFGIIQAEIHPTRLIDTMADLSSYYHSQSEFNFNENPS